MHFKIQLIVDDDQGGIKTEDVFNFERVGKQASLIGLSLMESKDLLKSLQKQIVLCQSEEFSNSHRHCSCSQKRRIKGYTNIQFRTLFGIVAIPSIRLYHCDCDESSSKTFSPLEQWLPEHVSPELQYIESKWASMMSLLNNPSGFQAAREIGVICQNLASLSL